MTNIRLELLRYLPWRYRHGIVNRFGAHFWLRGLDNSQVRGRFLGVDVELDLRDHIQFWMFVDGAFDLPFLHLFWRLLELLPRAIVLDIGANVGNHTVAFARSAEVVHAFEPNPTARERLHAIIAAHSCQNVIVHPVGLGESPGEREFFENAAGNLGSSTFVAARAESFAAVNRRSLRIERGDDYLAEHGIDRVSLVKLDVEGLEVEVLRGLRRTIAASRPLIIMEYRGETRRALAHQDVLESLAPEYVPWALEIGPSGLGKYFRRAVAVATRFYPEREYGHIILVPRESIKRFGSLLPEAVL